MIDISTSDLLERAYLLLAEAERASFLVSNTEAQDTAKEKLEAFRSKVTAAKEGAISKRVEDTANLMLALESLVCAMQKLLSTWLSIKRGRYDDRAYASQTA